MTSSICPNNFQEVVNIKRYHTVHLNQWIFCIFIKHHICQVLYSLFNCQLIKWKFFIIFIIHKKMDISCYIYLDSLFKKTTIGSFSFVLRNYVPAHKKTNIIVIKYSTSCFFAVWSWSWWITNYWKWCWSWILLRLLNSCHICRWLYFIEGLFSCLQSMCKLASIHGFLMPYIQCRL